MLAEHGAADCERIRAEATEQHVRREVFAREKFASGPHGNLGGCGKRVAIGAGGDGGKGNRAAGMLDPQLQ